MSPFFKNKHSKEVKSVADLTFGPDHTMSLTNKYLASINFIRNHADEVHYATFYFQMTGGGPAISSVMSKEDADTYLEGIFDGLASIGHDLRARPDILTSDPAPLPSNVKLNSDVQRKDTLPTQRKKMNRQSNHNQATEIVFTPETTFASTHDPTNCGNHISCKVTQSKPQLPSIAEDNEESMETPTLSDPLGTTV